MAISTNSIIHYTQEMDMLKGIIKEGFKIKYCLETLTCNGKHYRNAHPMISFCDIPLSDSGQHFGLYGYYGIGLTKKWAKRNRVNPVLYIDNESTIAESISESAREIHKMNDSSLRMFYDAFVLIKCFSKNYSGPLKRGTIDISNYKFYDEREWRFMPGADILKGEPNSANGKEYLKDKDSYNNRISHLRVMFSHDDISYIIVRLTSEIPIMIEFLRSRYYKTLTLDQMDILLSKVCSTEQILEDF